MDGASCHLVGLNWAKSCFGYLPIVSSIGMVVMNAGIIDEYQNDVEYIVESMAESLNQIYFPAIYMFKTAQFRKSVLANWMKLDPIWANHSFNESTKSLAPLFDSYRIIESALTGNELCEEDQGKLASKLNQFLAYFLINIVSFYSLDEVKLHPRND